MDELKPCTNVGGHCWHAKMTMAFSPNATVNTAMLMNTPGVCCWCGQEQVFYNGVPSQPHGPHHPHNTFTMKGNDVVWSAYIPPR